MTEITIITQSSSELCEKRDRYKMDGWMDKVTEEIAPRLILKETFSLTMGSAGFNKCSSSATETECKSFHYLVSNT
jgi:hypothetical protein